MQPLFSRRTLLAFSLLPLLPKAAQSQEPLRLLAFGDSLIAGYGLETAQGFCSQLEAALKASGQDVSVLNGGNSGDTSAAGLARLDWALGDKPDAVLLCLGANDALRGLPPEDTRANLSALLDKLAAQKLPVLLAGMMAPRNLGADYTKAFDAIYPELAAERALLFYPFFLDGVATQPTLNQSDGIHPNAEGVAEIVRRLLPKVHELLALVAV